jgi:hypothetical protein
MLLLLESDHVFIHGPANKLTYPIKGRLDICLRRYYA